MLRLLGAVITVLAALGYSAAMARDERARINKCKCLCDFLCECRLQVEQHSLPLDGILDGCAHTLPEGFIESAKQDGFLSAVDSWKSKLLDGGEEREILADFAQGFGRGLADTEVKRCSECIEKLKRHTEMLENSAKTDCKTRFAVSLCVSLMAVLFFA
ncbi:MAG: hypothetical protein IJF74_04285 [Clostridia bacterium]|nr:hypothetical protein [Clostridia bacterium]